MRRRGWHGPHPLLLAATVALFLVASAMSSHPGEPAAADTGAVELASGPVQGPGMPGTSSDVTTVRAASDVPRQVVGVATFNAYRQLTRGETIADARALARRDGVDVIGWQEAYRMGAVRPVLAKLGWRTVWQPGSAGAEELAISWRTDRFAFVSAHREQVANGVAPPHPYPVSPRFLLRVVLRDRTTGLRLTVITTHLPQAVERDDRPGRWRRTVNADRARQQLAALADAVDEARGRWVVATGDFNLDARAERRERPRGGPTRALAGRAVSSYQRLGVDDVAATHPVSGRHIDYVYAGASDVRQDRTAFVDQRAIRGLHSDHRPLLVRLALS